MLIGCFQQVIAILHLISIETWCYIVVLPRSVLKVNPKLALHSTPEIVALSRQLYLFRFSDRLVAWVLFHEQQRVLILNNFSVTNFYSSIVSFGCKTFINLWSRTINIYSAELASYSIYVPGLSLELQQHHEAYSFLIQPLGMNYNKADGHINYQLVKSDSDTPDIKQIDIEHLYPCVVIVVVDQSWEYLIKRVCNEDKPYCQKKGPF
jgi:hypothetical protein